MKYLITKRRPELRTIYQEWVRHNIRHSALQMLGISFVVMMMLAAFDFVMFGGGAMAYLPYRLACAATEGLIFLLVRSINYAPHHRRNLPFNGTAGILALAAWNAPYVYFYLFGPEAHHQVVVSAIYMNIYITQYFAQRFWRMHYVATTSFTLTFALIMWTFPGLRLEASSFALWNASVFVICWVQRRAFCSVLFMRYDTLRNQFPAKMARVICTESPSYTVDDVFKPVVRSCACICLDWRAFQAYVSSQPPEIVARQIQTVHDTVLAILRETIRDESYFADWTADEIFITVYSETDDVNAVLNNTWAFCQTFQKTIRSRLNEELGAKMPTIDIGAAVGTALVGLVGPTTMKKTTVVGAIGGIAKRLETAAKHLREHGPRSAAPILCVNEELYEYVRTKHSQFAGSMQPLRTGVKDLEGLKLYVYSEGLIDAAINPLPQAAGFH